MPPQLETHLELLMEPKLLDGLNRTFLTHGLQVALVLPQGQLHCPPLESCQGSGACLIPPSGDVSPGPCSCGRVVTWSQLSITQGPIGSLAELRHPDCTLPNITHLACDLVCREASLRYELQSTLEELISKYEELTVVYDSAEAIVSITDLEGVGQRITDQAADILDVDHASLMLLEGNQLVVKAARGTRTDLVGRVLEVGQEGQEISGYVAREGKPVLIEDLAIDPVFGRNFNRESDMARSLVSVPLKIKDRVLGVLNVNHKRSGEPFNSGDLKLLMALASLAAISVENARTYQNAITDRLTSLYNYGYFREQLDKAVLQARELESTLCLLMFDIDHFKNFNDVNGHALANVALVGVASLCLLNSRQKGDRVPDLVARYGGEEFMVMLSGITKEGARQTAERIRKRVENFKFEGGENQPMGKVTISIGVACYPEDATTADEMINQADQALYRAKRGGRNNVQLA